MCIENKDSLCTSEQRVYKNENSVYTPGPWKAGRSDMATIVDGVASKWIYAGDQYVAVASGRIDGDWDQVIANSQLIAAAPDLLEALQIMEVAFTPLAKDSTLANLIDEARAAIAKTTGVAKENFKSEAGFENKPADSFKARAQEQEPVATHICNLWVDPITKEYVVDHCDHPIDELIPAYAAPVQQAEQEPPVDSLMVDVSALLGPFVEDGKPIRVKDARDILRRVRKRRFTAEPAPVRTKDLTEKWIDPNDKSQKQYLPHIGEKILFCCDGEVYYGHHTGGSFQKGYGVTKSLFPTWDCMWMHLPTAVISADREKNK